MKSNILNGYFTKNLGDDLFLKVISQYSNLRYTIFVNKEFYEFYDRTFKETTINIRKRNLVVKILDKLLSNFKIPNIIMDLLLHCLNSYIEVGGSLFQQDSNYDELVTKKRQNILNSGINYFVVGSNFGAVKTVNFIKNYSVFFSNIVSVTFRDKYSFKLFNKISSVSYAPDLVFNLKTDNVKKYTDEDDYVVLNVMNLGFLGRQNVEYLITEKSNYENKLSEICIHLIDKGFKVKLVAFSELEEDLQTCFDICNNPILEGRKSKIEIITYDDVNVILSLYKSASMIISTRFHSMILSWVMGKKQLVLRYSSKTGNVINDLCPQQYSLTFEEFAIANVNTIVKSMNTMDDISLKEIQIQAKQQLNFMNKI